MNSMSVAFVPSLETYGRPIAKREFANFGISLGSHAAGEAIPAHRHADQYAWCVTLSGSFEEGAGGRCEDSRAGSMLIRPADCVHSDRFSRMSAACLNIFPRRSWLTANGFSDLADTYVHHRSPHLLALGHSIAAELMSTDAATGLAVECLLIEMLSRMTRLNTAANAGYAPWLAIALDEIEANPSGELRLAALARSSRISTGHLARAFRSAFGVSVGTYVRRRRLARAEAMLRGYELSLAEIAAAVGFYDQAHFSNAFRAQYGATPAKYRHSRGGA